MMASRIPRDPSCCRESILLYLRRLSDIEPRPGQLVARFTPKSLTALSYSPLVIEFTPRPHLDSAVATDIELKYSSPFSQIAFHKCTNTNITVYHIIVINSFCLFKCSNGIINSAPVPSRYIRHYLQDLCISDSYMP